MRRGVRDGVVQDERVTKLWVVMRTGVSSWCFGNSIGLWAVGLEVEGVALRLWSVLD